MNPFFVKLKCKNFTHLFYTVLLFYFSKKKHIYKEKTVFKRSKGIF